MLKNLKMIPCCVTPSQHAALKALSKRTRISIQDYLREAVADMLAKHPPPSDSGYITTSPAVADIDSNGSGRDSSYITEQLKGKSQGKRKGKAPHRRADRGVRWRVVRTRRPFEIRRALRHSRCDARRRLVSAIYACEHEPDVADGIDFSYPLNAVVNLIDRVHDELYEEDDKKFFRDPKVMREMEVLRAAKAAGSGVEAGTPAGASDAR